jgi:hypothetical protein
VRDQIRDQVKAECGHRQAGKLGAAQYLPGLGSRISFDGDLRLRDESRYYSGNNSNKIDDFCQGQQHRPVRRQQNSNTKMPPLLNTREDRENLFRLRARWA